MSFSTPLTDALGIDIPILLAPMAGGPTTPELVSAVSDAGGFGQFGAAYLDGTAIRATAGELQSRTNKGFGINLFIPEDPTVTEEETAAATAAIAEYFAQFGAPVPDSVANVMPDFDEQIAAVIESGIKLCSFHMGLWPQSAVDDLKAAGIVTVTSVTSVAEGHVAESSGIDFIIAQGGEAGGHRGTWIGDWEDSMTGTMSLVSQLTSTLSTPVIAGGGIMDGRGLAAALALGACGVQMGTAFLSCPEAGVHPSYKQALLNAEDDTTTVTKTFSGRPARGLRNRYINEMESSNAPILPFPLQNSLTGTLRKAAAEANDTDFMSMWCGQAASLSRGLPAAELIETIVAEYQEAANSAFHSSIG
ncbi:MAG: nitronate monooxygenase [Alphaproteobacteria bacterium]|nr:nitronate monooxygenase [Alphaproteobacteria bacterium]